MNFKRFISTVLTLIFIMGILFGAYKIYENSYEYVDGENSYEELNKYVDDKDTNSKNAFLKIDFSSLQQINPDVVGWIYIENTEINYPVVQTDNNTYYLKHLFNKDYNKLGSIFLDSRNTPDFSDKNSIIYGHNMKDGAMFYDLTNYKNQSYYKSHPKALLMTPNKNYELELFAGYVADTNDKAWQIDFSSDEDFRNWLDEIIKISTFESNVVPSVNDKIVTFSTCTYEFDDARFVLFGVIK